MFMNLLIFKLNSIFYNFDKLSEQQEMFSNDLLSKIKRWMKCTFRQPSQMHGCKRYPLERHQSAFSQSTVGICTCPLSTDSVRIVWADLRPKSSHHNTWWHWWPRFYSFSSYLCQDLSPSTKRLTTNRLNAWDLFENGRWNIHLTSTGEWIDALLMKFFTSTLRQASKILSIQGEWWSK